MNAIVAFLHHIAFVIIFLALAAEMLLLKQPLTVTSAKKIQRYDALYGMSAGLILVLGALRVMYFEKGADYYMHSAPFIIKIVLFLAAGLMSIYPTVTFLKWNNSLKQGVVPVISYAQNRKLRSVIHMELTLLVFVILCAALMAKGIGYFGG
jgi:putative membrane protein